MSSSAHQVAVMMRVPPGSSAMLSRATPWVQLYRWPIYYFVAVAFWNMIGAGLFGFMINPPIALYYMQGLNTTPLHGHAALFAVELSDDREILVFGKELIDRVVLDQPSFFVQLPL